MWIPILGISIVIIGLIKIALSNLHTYFQFKQYNNILSVLNEHKLKEYKDLEAMYIDTSTSTGRCYL